MTFASRSRAHVRSFLGGALQQQTHLVACADGRTGVLFDPGGATGNALNAAASLGLDIAAILLTHAHIDHIDGAALAKEVTGAPIHLHPADRFLYDNAQAHAAAYGVRCPVLPPPDRELAPGDALSFGGTTFEVSFAPGHSPGHVVFASQADGFAIVGDVIFHGSIGRTDLPGGDFTTLMDSIRRAVMTLPPDTRLHPGHGPATTVEIERRTNPFLVPAYAGQRA